MQRPDTFFLLPFVASVESNSQQLCSIPFYIAILHQVSQRG